MNRPVRFRKSGRVSGYMPLNFGYPLTLQWVNGQLVPAPRVFPAPVTPPIPGAPSSCGGGCSSCKRLHKGRRRLGDGGDPFSADSSPDVSIDPNTGCEIDSDGNLLTCPGGVDPYAPPNQPTINTAPNAPTTGTTTQTPAWVSVLNAAANTSGQILASTRGITPQQSAAQGQKPVAAPAAKSSTGLSTTTYGGIPVWGWGLLVLGTIVVARS